MSLRIIISGFLASLLLFFGVSGTVSAHETTPEHAEEHQIEVLVEQINSLLAIIAELQAQLIAANADPANSSRVGFQNNYGIGDENIEIRSLQVVLNSDSRTRVALSGPGSSGLESTYYGVLTADAVSRFQELYRSEILTPAGLSSGTGFFGPGTRAKMNDLVKTKADDFISQTPTSPTNSSIGTTQTTPTTQNPSASDVDTNLVDSSITAGNSSGLNALSSSIAYEVSDEFSVGEASSYAGAPGEKITIQGIKLTNNTKVNFDSTEVGGSATSDGKSFTFEIPDVVKGPYELTFSDGVGTEAIRIMDFVVTVENATAPEIYSISPSLGPDGTLITIKGSGFTTTGNQIEFGQNVVSGLSSSDGKTINVNVASGLEISNSAEFAQNGVAEWPVFVYIANANGRALEPGLFVIRN